MVGSSQQLLSISSSTPFSLLFSTGAGRGGRGTGVVVAAAAAAAAAAAVASPSPTSSLTSPELSLIDPTLSFTEPEIREIQDVENSTVLERLSNQTSNNITCSDYQRSIYPIALPLMLVFCILSIFLNFLIVLSTRWCRKPMTPTLYLSISLALADAFASLILAVGLVVNSLLPCVFDINLTPKSVCFNLAVEVLRLGGILITVVHLLALGINHWIGIIRPLHYAAIMTRRMAWIIILISWISPILLIFLYFSIHKDQGFLSEHCSRYMFMDELTWRVIFASSFFVPFLVMSLIYLHIYIIVKNHNQYRLRYQSSQQLQRNIKAVITTVLILGSYIVGWMPGILWYILVCKTCAFQLKEINLHVTIPVSIVINTLIILKALVNPIIYAARMSDIKIALKKMRYEFLSRCFGKCVHEEPPVDPLERGSLCESRSLRASSRNSNNSSRRLMGVNSINASSRSHNQHRNQQQQQQQHHQSSYHVQAQANNPTNGNNGNNNRVALEMSEWK